MSKAGSVAVSFLLLITLSDVNGQDYSVEVIDTPPEADEVSDALAGELAETGVRVKHGSSRTICEIWFVRQWELEADFEESRERLYPFSPGQLIGVLHFPRRGKDFRSQTVSSGWYTIRFGLQPVDGNHEGTSITRDFLMLIDAEEDAADKEWDQEELWESSSAVAGSTHPALMCLLQSTDGTEAALRHHAEKDWWILHVTGSGNVGDERLELPLDLVVVGHAEE